MSEYYDDIHDYFMNHPDDLPRIKYQRLIEAFVTDLKTVGKYQYGESWECDAILKKWEEKL